MLRFLLRWVAVLLLSVVALVLMLSLLRNITHGFAAASSVSGSLFVSAAPDPAASSSSVIGRPSLSASFINHVLTVYHSPATGLGQAMYADSLHAGIDDVFALAFFFHESQFGRLGIAAVTHSLGNIVCTLGYPSCIGRFRSYASWKAGCLDWFHLITSLYVPRGLTTVERIVPIYAPASENDVSAYIAAVMAAVTTWRSGRVEVLG